SCSASCASFPSSVCSSSSTSLLFLICSVPHCDLHSFPTRRSSDLLFDKSSKFVPFSSIVPWTISPGGLEMSRIIDSAVTLFKSRSEEHTSELQSRFDLVCRLLLEKKKKIKHITSRFVIVKSSCYSRYLFVFV